MAQSGYTPILIYASSTPGALPSAGDLTSGASGAELAINYADGKLYFKNSSGVVTLLAGSSSGPAGGSNTQVQYNSSGVLAGSSNLTFDGTSLTLGGNPTLSAGTANGVLYLNGSKVATSGSALTFDGTTFQYTGASNFATSSGNVGIGTSSPSYKLDVRVAPASGGAAGAGVTTGSYEGTILITGSAYNNYGVGANTAWLYSATNDVAIGPYGGSGTVQIVTGGARRATFDSSGNLGLGVTPSAWAGGFKVFAIGGNNVWSTNDSNTLYFTQNAYFDGAFKYQGSGYLATRHELANGTFKWYTAPSGTAGNAITFTQAMTLDASGNLGIGTSSPAQKLHVRQDQAAYTWGRVDNQSSSASAYSGWMLGAFGNSWGIAIGSSAANSNALTFVLDAGGTNAEKMRLDSSGNLGIGTSSPGSKLDVTTSGQDQQLRLVSTGNVVFRTRWVDATTGMALESNNSTETAYYPLSLTGSTLRIGTGDGSLKATLDSSGNLGLGVTPSAWSTYRAMQIGAGASVIGHPTTVAEAYLSANLYYSSGNKYIGSGAATLYSQSAGSHSWSTATSGTAGNAITFTQAMTLDASGNLALGGTSVIGGARADFRQNSNGNYSTTFTTATTKALLHLRDLSDVATYPTTFSTLLFGAGDSGAAYTTITCIRESSQNSAIAFGTASGSSNTTERARITSGGDLLVGTTTNGAGAKLKSKVSAGTFGLEVTDEVQSDFIVSPLSGAVCRVGPSAGAMALYAGNTERARITSGGAFYVGTTTAPTATAPQQVVKSGASDWVSYVWNSNAAPYGLRVQHDTDTNGTGNQFLFCAGSPNLRAEIRSNGGLANYSANDVNLSDRREKTNFAPAKSYLDTICAIPVQTFNYIDQSENDPGLTLGVVAQDVQAVAPELVMESNWGTEDNPKMRLSIYQTDLQYALMKCIQEQQALIQSLTARVALLEGN